MANPWAQIDKMKSDHEQLKTTLDAIGWRLCDSDDGFYVASRKSGRHWPPGQDRRVRCVEPKVLLERISKLEAECAPKSPGMSPAPS